MILADKIIFLRKQQGWNQEQLAEQLGVSRQAVSKWEGGTSIPDLDKIIKMSNVFGVATDYLLKDEIEELPKTATAETATSYDDDDSVLITIDDAHTYMYCERVRKSQNINNEDVINLHGYGFEYEITQYEDDTFVHWTEWMERDFKTYDVINELKRIEVISKNDFNNEFHKMIASMTKKHIDNLEYYENENL